MASPSGTRIELVVGRCHKCGRTRPTTGTPATCLGCLKHYQKNLNKRASRQAAATQPLTPEAEARRKTIQAMFDEALAEQMVTVVDEAAAIEVLNNPDIVGLPSGVLHDMAVRAGRESREAKMRIGAFAERLQAIQDGRLVVEDDVNTLDDGLEITGAAALPSGE